MSKGRGARWLGAVTVTTGGLLSGPLLAGDTDPASGLVQDEHMALVQGYCTPCHSAALITQCRASRERWQGIIRWMQSKQGLMDLGAQEGPILDYLTRHYGPVGDAEARRPPIAPSLRPPR